jgi:hypothetical protein
VIHAFSSKKSQKFLTFFRSLLQGSRKYAGLFDGIKKISAQEGLKSLYRGYGTGTHTPPDLTVIAGAKPIAILISLVMLTTFPGNMAYFASYELSVALTTSVLPFEKDSVIGQSLSGIPAQFLASLAFTPIDIVKERLQARQVSPKVVLSEIYNAAGILGFMRGYTAAVALWAPYGAIYLASYRALTLRLI